MRTATTPKLRAYAANPSTINTPTAMNPYFAPDDSGVAPPLEKKSINCSVSRNPTTSAPRIPNSASISRYDTPAATRSCTGNFCPASMIP